jgi:hypothetical protein
MKYLKNLFLQIKKHKVVFAVLIIGVVYRLLTAIFFTHAFDYLNILAIVKSVADTGSILDGFFVVKRSVGIDIQLYGKIYYQIAAIWMKFLEIFKILDIRYLFDTKGYENSYSYMIGFLKWEVPLYQLIAIKFIQFFYDFIFLFFLLKITVLIKPHSKKFILVTSLFWALNPIIVYSSYVMFQSDLAMLAALTGGIYFIILSLKNTDKNTTYYNVGAFVLLAIGAVIKQIPLLFVPLALILLSTNFVSLLINIVSFMSAYFITVQPWSNDISIINKFFLQSEESRKLFSFNLNGVPLFMILYISLLSTVLITRKALRSNPNSIIYLGTMLIAILYITIDNTMLFSQFNSWILPFLLFVSFLHEELSLFFVVPLIGFYKRALIDSDTLAGSLALSTGRPLHAILSYNDIIARFTDPLLVNYGMNTIITFCYLLLLSYSFLRLYSSKFKLIIPPYLKKFLQLKYVLLGIFIFYILFQITDFQIKSKFVFITDYIYENGKETQLTKKPIILEIVNPTQKKVTGLTMTIYTSGTLHNGAVLVEAYDLITKKTIMSEKINHYMFHSITDRTYSFYFTKTINSKHFLIKISNPDTYNAVYISEAKLIPNSYNSGGYSGDASYYKNNSLKINFPGEQFVVNINGQYSFSDMVSTFIGHIHNKPSFFILLAIILFVLSGSVVFLFVI